MLQKAGARSVVAVEANTRAFLKCLCTKELFGLDRVEFLLGDLVAYLNEERSKFDAVIASGVLYHMTDPVDLLKILRRLLIGYSFGLTTTIKTLSKAQLTCGFSLKSP